MYSKCIQKVVMNTGLLKKYLNTIRMLVFLIFYEYWIHMNTKKNVIEYRWIRILNTNTPCLIKSTEHENALCISSFLPLKMWLIFLFFILLIIYPDFQILRIKSYFLLEPYFYSLLVCVWKYLKYFWVTNYLKHHMSWLSDNHHLAILVYLHKKALKKVSEFLWLEIFFVHC